MTVSECDTACAVVIACGIIHDPRIGASQPALDGEEWIVNAVRMLVHKDPEIHWGRSCDVGSFAVEQPGCLRVSINTREQAPANWSAAGISIPTRAHSGTHRHTPCAGRAIDDALLGGAPVNGSLE